MPKLAPTAIAISNVRGRYFYHSTLQKAAKRLLRSDLSGRLLDATVRLAKVVLAAGLVPQRSAG